MIYKKLFLMSIILLIVMSIFIASDLIASNKITKVDMINALVYDKYCEKIISIKYNQNKQEEKIISKKYYIVVLCKGNLYNVECTFENYKYARIGKVELYDKNIFKE